MEGKLCSRGGGEAKAGATRVTGVTGWSSRVEVTPPGLVSVTAVFAK